MLYISSYSAKMWVVTTLSTESLAKPTQKCVSFNDWFISFERLVQIVRQAGCLSLIDSHVSLLWINEGPFVEHLVIIGLLQLGSCDHIFTREYYILGYNLKNGRNGKSASKIPKWPSLSPL